MAVVRVKRHCDEEPIDTLLLACKRRKTEDDHLTSIFKFATTVANQDENISKHIPKTLNSTDAKTYFKSHNITKLSDKLRAENKLFSQNNRFKVVNCFRALDELDSFDEDEGSSSDRGLTVVDVESLASTETSKTSTLATADTEDNHSKYVYDIYYAPDCKLDEKMLDDSVRCLVLDEVVFEDYSNDTYAVDEESDDSNDENNWRNDYPDKDPDSIDEDDMKIACEMGDLNLSETNSLSSDGGEEALVYGMDDPDYTTGIDPNDVDNFGYDYAAFKKRITMGCDSESENSDFFFCDSDLESDKS